MHWRLRPDMFDARRSAVVEMQVYDMHNLCRLRPFGLCHIALSGAEFVGDQGSGMAGVGGRHDGHRLGGTMCAHKRELWPRASR